ncbi:MAG: peptide deformylase [Candidatus Pacebacteria bacterium]|nr:peptide deformylase [Candidatus Paceibacterota bacterium]
MKKIVQEGDPVLRKKAEPVDPKDINTDAFRSLLKEMHESLKTKEHGVALAAPQIGVSKRVFVVSPTVFEEDKRDTAHLVYINPEITKLSKKRTAMEEGCLSVEGRYGTTKRAEKATIHALDEDGQPFTVGASGLLAQIFQHETDHLNGVLYVDHASETYEIEEDH